MTDLKARPGETEFNGEVLTATDPGYDEARRVFNAMIDRRPGRIMRCQQTADVVAALQIARETGLPVSVYGGGHGVTGSAVIDDGICIDLRGLDRVEIDPQARIARVGGGCTWGRLDAATAEHGLAVTGGRVSTTGVGGLALGSGSGWLERAFGFTCDNLIAAEVVAADGRVVTASQTENPDLFWGLRGGGGNFGIVTEFTLQLHELGPLVLGGMLMHPAERAGELLRFWRDFMLEAPDEVGSGCAFICAPPLDLVPEPVRGKPVVGVVICYAGSPEQGQQVLAPLLEFGPPAVSLVQPMPYVAVQRLLDEANPHGLRNYWTADFLTGLPDEAIDALVPVATRPVSPLSQILVVAGGGAIARTPEDATAFGQRTAPFNMHYLSIWPDPADDEANIAHTREAAGTMKPWSTGRLYLNYIGDEGPGRVRAAYGPEKFARLQKLKHTWDPGNVFCHNQNIPPA
ncbi:MAG TPA: FAD-binding oxidoreductase [Nocardioidaceae bacterium]|nr:FAD-binding oxidoreductase [Nocardioidaceae bacterium]